MSIQQDKRVVKPSKMSERYARWFETRVPSTSPLFRYLVMYTFSFPVSAISAYLILHFVDSIFVFILNLGIGVFLYLLFLNIIQKRFQAPITDQRFSQIVASAQDQVVTWRSVSVWPRQSAEPFIASTFNMFFDAVIVSDTMIDLIIKMPESGEALLAYHILRAPKRRSVLDFVAAILIFFISTILFTYVFLLLFTIPYYGYESSMAFILALMTLVQVPIYFIAPVIFIFAIRGAFWTHDSAFEKVSDIYQIHPQVAKDEVMSSQKLDEEAAKSTVWVVREWERKKRGSRQTSITMSVVVLTFFLILLVFSYYASIFYYIYTSSLYFVVLLIPILNALLAYFLIRRWDKRCMAELYYETKQADEPIWVD
ncbi:MAG: hypothetical protein ACFFDV_10550 [Candidatus Thorarchaeota archaeon]